jgi:hypothetical protein
MRLKGVIAVDNEPLYDLLTLPSTLSAGEYCFFQVPLGGTDPFGAASNSKTRCETNCTNAGRLPEPERFEIVAYQLVPNFASTAADVVIAFNRSYFEIRTGGSSTVAHRVPTRLITAGTGIFRTDAAASVVGNPQPQSILSFSPETTIVIELNENFQACLIVCASGLTLSAVLPIMCVFQGYHAKGVRKG